MALFVFVRYTCLMEYERRQIHIKTEKLKARKLRQSRWWNQICQSAICYYCSNKLDPDAVTMDHVVPLSRGGKSNKGNIVVACKPCNTKKRDFTAAELLL